MNIRIGIPVFTAILATSIACCDLSHESKISPTEFEGTTNATFYWTGFKGYYHVKLNENGYAFSVKLSPATTAYPETFQP